MIDKQRPLDALAKSINTNVTVYLKSGECIKGILKAYDLHLNIALENVTFENDGKEFSNIVIRGDNILYISL